MPNDELKTATEQLPIEAAVAGKARGYAASDYEDYDGEDCCAMCCAMCGGDGVVMLSECGPSEWGEDCFCEEDRVVECPDCRERERYEQMRKQQEAKRDNNAATNAIQQITPHP